MAHTGRPTFIWKIAAFFALTLMFALATTAPRFAGTATAAPRTVCVDAGHGGSDPGASFGALLEKNLTLDIANRLKTLLEGEGYGVVMTRTGDQSLGNTDRANICNGGGADTVLSIHLNSSSNTSIDYFKAFYGKQIKDRDFTQTISANYNLLKPDGTGPLPKNSPSQFASGLLLKTNAPASLAETVFLSNPAEQSLLADGTGKRQQDIAENLFKGVVAWYNR